MKKFKVIIVDDERSAREEIRRALLPYPDYEVIGEARNADEAEALIHAHRPDLLFLDIRMPERSGFDLLAALPDVPEVIFTTAFDQYAVQAFDNNALDYLMKPIRVERFAQAMEKHGKKMQENNTTGKQLFIKDGEQCYFIKLKDIYLVESADNYARLHFNDKKALIRASLHQLEEKLDPDIFFRINRTQLINTQYITHIQPTTGGRFTIHLYNMTLEISSRQSVKFRQWNKP
ncbi:MAG TPA: LytTR family DNA-binding domain-containing protein [Chitinophaga sp.]|uniref:LytR/AlgR family response regulator transcription factor n=1 Tax=Chitinophaga sp. TaxID=1869181 RepID=UPI002B57D0A9|nr:LytTR family DNA-binding domain-containing protein [Chitinophaga sp.]HVI46874.1 LytTR family DNA-binding domain-containing protein [Chitinophaga sp.]